MVIRVKLQLMLEIEKQKYLLFKRGRHDHNVLACSSKSLQYCVEGLEFELEDNPKEEENHNEDGLSEKCDYYEKADWKCINIFPHTASQGKLCALKIDGGSYSNPPLEELIKKLIPKTKDHLNPYQITCVTVLVSYCCPVPFQL